MRRSGIGKIQIVATAIAAQSLCLAVGLVMQNRYIHATITRDAERQARSFMLEQWGPSVSAISGAEGHEARANPIEHNAIEQMLTHQHPQGPARFLIIGDAQQVIYVDRMADCATGSPPTTIAARAEFTPLDPDRGAAREGSISGYLTLGDKEYPAIAWHRATGSGYLVVYATADPIRAESGSLLAALPAIGGLTWLWTSALLGIFSYLLLSRLHERSSRNLSKAETDGNRQRQHVVRTRDAVIFGLAKLAESRDSATGDHLERISVYSTMLAQTLSRNPKYAQTVTPTYVRNLGSSSVLHDIGKVGIEDRILLKPGRFTSAERSEMETHCRIASDCLREIEQRLGRSNFLEMAREIAMCHHEWWDGGGYPNGLKGEQIPLSARIVAIVDVYDALCSRRVYKAPKSHEDSVELIRSGAGKQFDPDLVEVWLTLSERFAEIARRYATDEENSNKPTDPETTASGTNKNDRMTLGSAATTKSPKANLEPDFAATTD
ncbi:MAG: HD domain-containing protein [Planctomycetes bacterium]|nr:HD domain-containing protein [Planctomycetota bacterium]MBI3834520.1 HD domain-containing protein [Planctomycetota bacterium]